MDQCSRNSLVLLCSPPSWDSWLDGRVEWPFEDCYSCYSTSSWQYLAELEQGSSGCCVCSESAYNMWCSLTYHQNSRVQASRVEKGVVPLINTLWHTSKILIPVPSTLCSGGLKNIVVKGELLLPRNNNGSYELKTAAHLPQIPFVFRSTGKEGSCYADWVTDLVY